MKRRIVVAVAATATLGLAAGVSASTASAAKNTIVIRGNFEFRAGKGVSDNQRFLPHKLKVKSGATVTVRNKSKTQDPHSLSFIEKQFLPVDFEPAAAGPLFGLHNLSDDPSAQPVLKIDNGAPAADQAAPLSVDTLGTPDAPGDSLLMFPDQRTTTFKVNAPAGATLNYFCIFHPWMQAKIAVR